jgi:aldose 1-epimerase
MLTKSVLPVIVLFFMIGCNPKTETNDAPGPADKDSLAAGVTQAPFGELADGTKITAFTLRNSRGVVMKVINYGGIITSLLVPDRNGRFADIVLGYDSVVHYERNNPYFGALIGRYGNRIAKGKFKLDGKQYTLATNNDQNHLHGGVKGFDKVFWNIEQDSTHDGVAIKLTYNSKDMEEGYPGNLRAEVTYTLTNNNELRIQYNAATDKRTIVNLTQHTYFNLNGAQSDILSHDLEINADRFLPVDATLIPTGELKKVEGTPFDFRKAARIGSRINENDQQLKYGKGYDHCWALNTAESGLTNAAVLYDSVSGREVKVLTAEPGIQFYSGNFLDGSNVGKRNTVYKYRYGLCLETQHFPDSPNRPEFPSVVLEPGKIYTTETVYRFSVR